MRSIKFRMWGICDDSPYDEETDSYLPVMIDGDSLSFEHYSEEFQPVCDLLRDTDNCKFMQYTGLKDKDGKEIYEGDIIGRTDEDSFSRPVHRIVEFKNGAFMAVKDNSSDIYLSEIASDCKVLGNKYENPELIFSLSFEAKDTLECQMISRQGTIIKLHQISDDQSLDLYFRDDKNHLYKKGFYSTNLSVCDSSGIPERLVGKLDIKDYWESFGDVPMDPETECIEQAWGIFPAGTDKEEIWQWFQKEFGIPVSELLYNMDKVDKNNLIFNGDAFGLKENKKFRRKDLETAQAQGR